MRLVVDSNRLIAALIRAGTAREILNSGSLEFFTTDYVLEEIMKYKDYIIKKSKLGQREIELLFALVMQRVDIVPESLVKEKMDEAMDIMKDIDINDAPIVACTLAIESDGLWSEDKHFDRQNRIKIWKTKDLIKYVD